MNVSVSVLYQSIQSEISGVLLQFNHINEREWNVCSQLLDAEGKKKQNFLNTSIEI